MNQTFQERAEQVMRRHFITGGHWGDNETNALAALTAAHNEAVVAEMESLLPFSETLEYGDEWVSTLRIKAQIAKIKGGGE